MNVVDELVDGDDVTDVEHDRRGCPHKDKNNIEGRDFAFRNLAIFGCKKSSRRLIRTRRRWHCPAIDHTACRFRIGKSTNLLLWSVINTNRWIRLHCPLREKL